MNVNLPLPKGIIFDLGNTVLREERYDLAAGLSILLTDSNQNTQLSQDKIEDFAADLKQEIQRCHLTTPYDFKMRAFLPKLHDRLGIPLSLEPIEAELKLWKAVVSLMPEDGISELLEELQQRGIKAGIVSNAVFSQDILKWELSRHGLAKYFQFVISSADYGYRKPHSSIFLSGVSKLGLKPNDVWFVGDSWEADIIGAISAGLWPVWYKPSLKESVENQPHSRVQNWAEFLEVFEEIYEKRNN